MTPPYQRILLLSCVVEQKTMSVDADSQRIKWQTRWRWTQDSKDTPDTIVWQDCKWHENWPRSSVFFLSCFDESDSLSAARCLQHNTYLVNSLSQVVDEDNVKYNQLLDYFGNITNASKLSWPHLFVSCLLSTSLSQHRRRCNGRLV